jgi:PKHD-type hydroxylase
MLYPIPPRNNAGKELTAYWEGFLTPEEIEFILTQPEWENKEDGKVWMPGDATGMDSNIRSTKVSWLTTKPEMMPIWNKFANVVAEVNRKFFHLDLTGFYEPMQLGLYEGEAKGHYDWHTDGTGLDKAVPRKLSVVMLLSDPSEFEGGEFQIKTTTDTAETLEIKKGRAWFFPSYMLHRVTPVTKGVRKSLVLWVGGPQFR